MTGTDQRQLERLLSALCDGRLEDSGYAQLDDVLRQSRDARQVYLEFVDMHARLAAHPNLTTGIPDRDWLNLDKALRSGEDDAPRWTADDDVVLELAQASLETFVEKTTAARRKWSGVFPFMALTLVITIVGAGWWVNEQALAKQRYPVLHDLVGEVTIEGLSDSAAARVGLRLKPGETLDVAGDEAMATLRYTDGTTIIVCLDSAIAVPAVGSDVSLRLLRGTLEVDAAAQPRNRPLVFATDHARYVVLGTRFRLYREAQASRLELGEGKVRLERQVDGKSVDISAGQVAIATADSTPVDIQPLPTVQSNLLLELRKAGQAVDFAPDGKTFVTADWRRGLKTWSLSSDKPRQQYQAEIGRSGGLALTEQGAANVSFSEKRASVTLWRPGDAKRRTSQLPGQSPRTIAISPEGSHAAKSDVAGTHIYKINAKTAQPTLAAELPGKGKAWCLALSPSAEFAAAGFWDGTLRAYDVRAIRAGGTDGDTVVFEHRLKHTPTKLAISADGGRLAVYSHKDGLLLIDVVTRELKSIWASGAAAVACVELTPDNRLIAGLSDGTARMWSATDGRAILVVDTGKTPREIAWSAQQSILATANGTVRLWKCELP